jgi:SAM-dependent methyltransferase
VYSTKAPDRVSWFRPHLDASLATIERAAPDPAARIVDVGGGHSTLVDDLLAAGYRNLAVIDISAAALQIAKVRLGPAADRVDWIVADITRVDFPPGGFDVWHDRAVFHFLTSSTDRAAYVERAAHALRRGGYAIVGTFGPQGPVKCSGLDVRRYDADSLHGEFGARFRLVDSFEELHRTPFGTTQQFVYCFCAVE